MTNVVAMREGAPAELRSYLEGTWLTPSIRQRFVSLWADAHRHYGQRATSRVEGAHAKLKLEKQFDRKKTGWKVQMLGLVKACITLVHDYRGRVDTELAKDRTKFDTEAAQVALIAPLRGIIGRRGVKLVGRSRSNSGVAAGSCMAMVLRLWARPGNPFFNLVAGQGPTIRTGARNLNTIHRVNHHC